jgi:uncharacterized membrane protein (GlpM family)
VALLIKALAGALVVVVIQLLARSRSYYIAGMVPLFPTFALISHYLVGTERTAVELRRTILFGLLSLIPYSVYLASLYYFVGRWTLRASLVGAVACWTVAAAVLIVIWERTGG